MTPPLSAMTTPRLRKFWTLLILVAGMVGSMFAAGQWAWRRSLMDENLNVQRQLALYGQTLAQRIDRYRTLPEVLALDPQLQSALHRPLGAAEVAQLNLKLEQANGATQSSTLTLINREGLAVAASNWRTATSNVGMDYSFRPYVQQALAQGRGSFYGIGVTTGEPGYFLSQAIRDESGQALGLVAIKIALQELEREWLQTPDIVLASDAHGVVFLASQDIWRYRLLAPLDDEERRELNATRQYSDQPLRPMDYRVVDTLDPGGKLVSLQQPALPGRVLWQTSALPGTPWQLHLVHDTHSSVVASRWAAAAGAGGWLAVSLLVLFVRQRQRLSALRQRSRQELETVLRQHAEELRTAQDGIVQAARQADTGLSRSLEHLPQGVVIIDADLQEEHGDEQVPHGRELPPDALALRAAGERDAGDERADDRRELRRVGELGEAQREGEGERDQRAGRPREPLDEVACRHRQPSGDPGTGRHDKIHQGRPASSSSGSGGAAAPSASSRSAQSSSGEMSNTASSMPAWRSPRRAKRSGTVAIVKSSGSTSSISSQAIGVDTVPMSLPRTEYAAAMVWSRAFWL